jgi:CspA family cold shock protein
VLAIVKFFKANKGWGVLVSSELPSDVWVHFSVIEGEGFREFAAGDVVEFDVEQVKQDSFDYRATRAVLVRHGPAPTLRRVGGRVVSAERDAPDTPLLPHRPKGS